MIFEVSHIDRHRFLIDGKEYKILFSNSRPTIVQITDGRSGTIHSAHPSIDATGSVAGMKARGYWRKHDNTIKVFGCIYNHSSLLIDYPLDKLCYHLECKYRGKNIGSFILDLVADNGKVEVVEFNEGDRVIYNSRDDGQIETVILDNYGDPIFGDCGQVRIESDGNQSIEKLEKI